MHETVISFATSLGGRGGATQVSFDEAVIVQSIQLLASSDNRLARIHNY